MDVREAKAAGRPDTPIGQVTAHWDPGTRYLMVEDNGTGMDRDIIAHHLMNVGSSFYNSPQFESEQPDFAPIPRFGIGILTCFMVSDDVEIVTAKRDKGYRIRMTSVQSNYLLRELSWGDPLLKGLLPHGTRVRLRLREAVDVSKETVEDIVRYWIILPECEVKYDEPGRKPAKVGFESPEKALRYYHSGSFEERDFLTRETEIISKTQLENPVADGPNPNIIYALAFGIRSGFTPEKSFLVKKRLRDQKPVPAPPGICIEGIRVDDALPGFKKELVSLLSVRGSKKLRTTVSRSGMEQDEEYTRGGKMCAEMHFGHIEDEVQRISKKPGSPLSQASTACDWLYTDLRELISSRVVEAHLVPLYDALPSIVKEEILATESKTGTARSMLSPSNLRQLPAFWTVESRLVDSLGVISRDLGHELSLNQFLLALAPDVKQLQYSPLLPDAHLFRKVFIALTDPSTWSSAKATSSQRSGGSQRGEPQETIFLLTYQTSRHH